MTRISTATRDAADPRSQKNLHSDESQSDENENSHNEDPSFLKPFLSGWQRVWSNRKKWFGTGSEVGPEQPQSQNVAGSVECSGRHQELEQPQLSVGKDPAAVLQTKYRRMSLKRTGGRCAGEGLAGRGSNPGALQHLSDEERPPSQVHTQVDYTNFLIPCQADIIHCPFYWGKIDRYEAEALLANKPEGSFLLRDSAQDDFVFSVSFRRYSRSLHARIEEVRLFTSLHNLSQCLVWV